MLKIHKAIISVENVLASWNNSSTLISSISLLNVSEWELLQCDRSVESGVFSSAHHFLFRQRSLVHEVLSTSRVQASLYHLKALLPHPLSCVRCPPSGPGGASEAGAEGGGSCPEGGPQEDLRHPEAAVGPGAADTPLWTGGWGQS